VADAGLLYNGGTAVGFCPSSGTFDGITQDWFAYSDPAGAKAVGSGTMNGCNGAGSCAFTVTGSGYAEYAGIGLTLGNPSNSPTSLSQYEEGGIYAWIIGTDTNVRAGGMGSDYNTAENNVVHIKFSTGADGGDEFDNDDFGFYCPIQPTCWTLCASTFANLTQDQGYGIDDASAFDFANVLKLEFEASAYTNPDGGSANMSLDFTVGNVGFFTGTGAPVQDASPDAEASSDASGQ
jgi:hypothetical protein